MATAPEPRADAAHSARLWRQQAVLAGAAVLVLVAGLLPLALLGATGEAPAAGWAAVTDDEGIVSVRGTSGLDTYRTMTWVAGAALVATFVLATFAVHHAMQVAAFTFRRRAEER